MRNFGAAFRILAIAVLTGLVALTTVAFGPTGIAQPPAGGLSLAKSAAPSAGLRAGDTVTYTFVVTNTGATPISDVGVEEVAFTGSDPAPGATCPAAPLQPGQSVTCTATYDVTDADQAACLIDNTARATGVDPAPVESLPASARVLTDCTGDLAGSAILPLLGSSGAGSFALGPLAVGSLGLGSLGALGASVGAVAWALATPYQPVPTARCQDAPYPIVPFLIPPCPGEPSPEGP